jgi:hypothetical protein
MAQNSIEAIINDLSSAMIYLQAIQSSKLKQENQRLSESIEEVLADALVQVQIVKQHLIDRELTIQKLTGAIGGIEDELESEEYEMKERATPFNRSSRTASQSSKTHYTPTFEEVKETPLDLSQDTTKEEINKDNIKESILKP